MTKHLKIMLTNKVSLLIILYLPVLTTSAQVDSINTINNKLIYEQLNFNQNTYVVYFQDSLSGLKYNISIWDRKLSPITINGQERYQLNWRRHNSDTAWVANYKIVVDSETFTPISEKIVVDINKPSKRQLRRYFIFENNKMITSSDTVLHNDKEVKIENLNYAFNWELDMETFSILPLAKDKRFAINFYHPGGMPPAYYLYVVTSIETIIYNNKEMDCWILKKSDENGDYSKFWIAKDSHQVLKLEEKFGDQYRFKFKISG